MAALVAVALGLWSARRVVDVYESRLGLTLMDFTRVTVIAAAGTLAAITVVVPGLGTACFSRVPSAGEQLRARF